jgi:hypothetical protein
MRGPAEPRLLEPCDNIGLLGFRQKRESTMIEFRKYWRHWLRWEYGRQNTGFAQLLLFINPFLIPFNCYLLRFPEGSHIPPHRDPVKSGRHFRLNIIVKLSPSGGEFVCADPIFQTRRLKLFRSDVSTHSVTRVLGGSRYVISIGWILPPIASGERSPTRR